MLINKLEGVIPLQVSKWIKIPFLLDACEMEDLILNGLPQFSLYDIHRVNGADEGIYSPHYFLEAYDRYIEALKSGSLPSKDEYRIPFSMAWSLDNQALYSLATEDGRRLIKAALPIVQMQMNEIRYSPDEKVFRTQIFGPDTITWGVQVGFPFLYMDPKSCEAIKTVDFPNMALFSSLQKWIRKNTVPTPFLVDGEQINSPIRLGKMCFPWIANHPQLNQFNIKIK